MVKVIDRTNLPARFPIGWLVFTIWIGEKINSQVYWTIFFILWVVIAATTLFRQMGEVHIELGELNNEITHESKNENHEQKH